MLNAGQEQARTLTTHGLVTACPGAGKTKTLEERVKFLFAGSSTNQVCAVTFTRDAAESLKERVARGCPNEVRQGRLIAGTFHSLCMRQLQRATGRKVRICSDAQAEGLLRTAYVELVTPMDGIDFETCVRRVESWKSQVDVILPANDVCAKVFERFQALLFQTGQLQFSDIVRQAVFGMRDRSVAPVPCQDMLVDECQDVDQAQLAWVLEHAKAGVRVMVVGDDDQSVYGFRDALGFEGMVAFQRETNASHISLDITYRCPREVLEPAATLIAHNSARVPKQLRTANSTQGEVRVEVQATRRDEHAALIDAVLASGAPEKWGILARTNALLEDLELSIGQAFPYYRKGGSSFWDLAQPALYLAVVQSLSDGGLSGIDALLRRCGISQPTLDALHERYRSNTPGALDRFVGDGAASAPQGERTFMRDLQRQLRAWRGLSQGDDDDVRRALLGVGMFLIEHGQWKVRSKRAPDGGEEPESRTTERRVHAAMRRISGLAGPLSRRLAMVQQQSDDKTPGAQLLTMHGSKGLEFDHVWILGCNASVIPSQDSPLEEERRLMYVALTRAMKTLTVSYAISDDKPSALLAEAGLLR